MCIQFIRIFMDDAVNMYRYKPTQNTKRRTKNSFIFDLNSSVVDSFHFTIHTTKLVESVYRIYVTMYIHPLNTILQPISVINCLSYYFFLLLFSSFTKSFVGFSVSFGISTSLLGVYQIGYIVSERANTSDSIFNDFSSFLVHRVVTCTAHRIHLYKIKSKRYQQQQRNERNETKLM